MTEHATEKIEAVLLSVVEELRGIKGVINAGIATQSMSNEVLVKMALLEERMAQTNRSLSTLQKTLLGLVVSILLSLISFMMRGSLG